MRPLRVTGLVALAAAMAIPVLLVGADSSANASAAPLTVAYITAETGAAAPIDSGDVGVFMGRIDA